MDLILKTETDGRSPTKILCLTLLDYSSGALYEYGCSPFQPIAAGVERLKLADCVVSHTSYHRRVLRDLGGYDIPDTLFMDSHDLAQRWCEAEAKADSQGHGLSAWAGRLGYPRVAFDFSQLTPCWTHALQDRCRADTYLVRALLRYIAWKITQSEAANAAAASAMAAQIAAATA